MLRSTTFSIVATAALATAAVACVVESNDHGMSGGGSGMASTPNPSGTSATPPSSVAPILVEVDTNKTMNAAPGDGVGVFVEYGAGGKWHVWWTCDTNRTAQTCDFRVKASVTSGAISNAKTEKPGEAYLDPALGVGATSIGATTTTTTQIHGVTFETQPGAVITIDAAVGQYHDSSFLFFVQDGKVNGGYAGKLTNPLQFVGKTP